MVDATDVGLDPVASLVAVRQLYAGAPDPEGNSRFLPLAKRVGCEVVDCEVDGSPAWRGPLYTAAGFELRG